MNNNNANIFNEIEEALKCNICFENSNKFQVLNCGHSFCSDCMSEHQKNSENCPQCRQKIKQVSNNYTLNALAEIFLKKPNSKTEIFENKNENTLKAPKRIPITLCPSMYEKLDKRFGTDALTFISKHCPACSAEIDQMFAKNFDQIFGADQKFGYMFYKGEPHQKRTEPLSLLTEEEFKQKRSKLKRKKTKIQVSSNNNNNSISIDLTNSSSTEEDI